MKNKFKKFLLITIIFLSNNFILHANEQFNFDVTEVEITEKGNKFIGKKRGLITTQDNIEIEADQFEYNKISNILKLTGNVKIKDFNQDSIIYSKKITYYKNQEIYKSESSSKFINTKDNIEIEADQFKYDKISNILELNLLSNAPSSLSKSSTSNLLIDSSVPISNKTSELSSCIYLMKLMVSIKPSSNF